LLHPGQLLAVKLWLATGCKGCGGSAREIPHSIKQAIKHRADVRSAQAGME
jgi:Fe-S cluster biogenesis protein NfuA